MSNGLTVKVGRVGFVTHLMHKPMERFDVTGQCAQWRAWHEDWVARAAENRAACYRRENRKAIKASRLERWRKHKAEAAARRKVPNQEKARDNPCRK